MLWRIGTFVLDILVMCALMALLEWWHCPPVFVVWMAFGWGLVSMVLYIELWLREGNSLPLKRDRA